MPHARFPADSRPRKSSASDCKNAAPRDLTHPVREPRKTIPLPSMDGTPGSIAVRAKQKEGPATIAEQHSPDDA
jgi:hypothetical protein